MLFFAVDDSEFAEAPPDGKNTKKQQWTFIKNKVTEC